MTLVYNSPFTSYNNPKGNAEIERLLRTLKEELIWLREWRSLIELFRALGQWMEEHDHRYLHSALGYQSPAQFEQHHSTQFLTA